VAPSLFLVGPTTIKLFFLLNQTVLCVADTLPNGHLIKKKKIQKKTKKLK